MSKSDTRSGSFTLPGESGYEALTLKLAKTWGADMIRDSDGTHLSDEILNAGYGIYSTICIIRQHNAFAKAHPDAQQQTFLCSRPAVASGEQVTLDLLDMYFREQFEINDTPSAMAYWQVYDRTENVPVPNEKWHYENGAVTVKGCTPFHTYTVSFLCWRVWEEINMYNHTTNHWTSEHLRQLDPRHPAAWTYLKEWLRDWCKQNPVSSVVRFTSLFYNFVFIWGESLSNRHLFSDWASYDFTVSPAALNAFYEEYGYRLTAEDFVNGGKYQVTHMPPTPAKRDYMAFIQAFVARKARELVDIVHEFGKKAFVFYDDSWVGMEPYGKNFESIGFDGIIKCVFSGFECRLCANVPVPIHEIRLHPYLFPVGLGGAPTFSEGGHPDEDARRYWKSTRCALARQCVDRIGLGGYLHLTQDFPAFTDAIEQIADQFRQIKALSAQGAPETLPCRVKVLDTWGALRSWTLSGHFHETDMHVLIHVNEALSGLPVEVSFISFEDVKNGALKDADVVINAGRAGDAWSGGDAWKDAEVVTALTRFVYEGGAFIGIGEPSATDGYDTFFRLANLLGVDQDTGARVCHGKWRFEVEKNPPVTLAPEALGNKRHLYLTDEKTKVLYESGGVPQLTCHAFGQGKGIYLSDFKFSDRAARMLLELLLYACGLDRNHPLVSDNPNVEITRFPSGAWILLNNASDAQCVTVDGRRVALSAGETKIINA